MGSIPAKLIEDTARELMARAAIDIPPDYRDGVRLARDREKNRLARFVLDEMLENLDIATASTPLRPNRVHPLTREDQNNNVGYHAPEVTYSIEPGGDWLDVTTVHKGGLFGTDWRMLFPGG